MQVTQTLTYATSIAWDCDSGASAVVTLTGDAAMASPTNVRAGVHYILKVIQDSTGGRKITSWGDRFQWSGNVLPTLTTTANGIDIFGFVSDGFYLYATGNYADSIMLFFEDELIVFNDEVVYL